MIRTLAPSYRGFRHRVSWGFFFEVYKERHSSLYKPVCKDELGLDIRDRVLS
jgi:hypothetical protein